MLHMILLVIKTTEWWSASDDAGAQPAASHPEKGGKPRWQGTLSWNVEIESREKMCSRCWLMRVISGFVPVLCESVQRNY